MASRHGCKDLASGSPNCQAGFIASVRDDLQKGPHMSTLAATFFQLRVPSAKTIVVSLLQAFAFSVMLYIAALICASTSEVITDRGEVVQMLCRWAWVAPAPFYAMAIGIKLTADALGDASIASNAWLRMPARIAFSIPAVSLIIYETYLAATNIAATQDINAICGMLVYTIVTIVATLAVFCYYVNKLDGFKDKPVADALFVSFFPAMPAIAIFFTLFAIMFCICAIALLFMLRAASCTRYYYYY